MTVFINLRVGLIYFSSLTFLKRYIEIYLHSAGVTTGQPVLFDRINRNVLVQLYLFTDINVILGGKANRPS